jgi:thiosulfate/3-mercaptopyruvate sulfurtransferase
MIFIIDRSTRLSCLVFTVVHCFQVFGHSSISVLDGGSPQWVAGKRDMEVDMPSAMAKRPSFIARFSPSRLCSFENALLISRKREASFMIDTRLPVSFSGSTPEVQPGLQSGHIPGAINIPYTDMLRNGQFKPRSELRELFVLKGLPTIDRMEETIVAYCSSGLTACIALVALEACGYTKLSLFNGSWAEYGRRASANDIAQS